MCLNSAWSLQLGAKHWLKGCTMAGYQSQQQTAVWYVWRAWCKRTGGLWVTVLQVAASANIFTASHIICSVPEFPTVLAGWVPRQLSADQKAWRIEICLIHLNTSWRRVLVAFWDAGHSPLWVPWPGGQLWMQTTTGKTGTWRKSSGGSTLAYTEGNVLFSLTSPSPIQPVSHCNFWRYFGGDIWSIHNTVWMLHLATSSALDSWRNTSINTSGCKAQVIISMCVCSNTWFMISSV